MFAIDLHTHTRFFHGHDRAAAYYDPFGYRLLEAVARRHELDGVALTNHDYYRPLGAPAADESAFIALPGIEVSTTKGHVLVVGPEPPTVTEPGTLSPEETVELAHDRGCAAIIAHPFRNSTIRELDIPFDAIEVNGKHPVTWPLVRELARVRDLPIVGGSDAHYPVEVGRAYTRIDADELTPESVVEAIRDGRVEPASSFGPFSRLVHRAYRTSHRRKDYLGALEESETVGEVPSIDVGASQ